jgi:uncharacterized protein (DUF1697 family)
MMKYVAFLRGINVGGRTSIKMERLREVFGALGFENVKTYIQSGNVIFETDETDDRKLAEKIEAAVEKEFFKTSVMVRSLEEIKEAVENNPFAGEEFEDKLFHLVFLSEKLSEEKAEMLLANNSENEKFAVRNREVYCLLKNSTADSLLGKKYIDNKLKTPATARNWRTVNKILEL